MADVPDLPQAGGPALLDLAPEGPRNWAEDPLVVARLKRELVPLVNDVRDRRQALNEDWRSLMRVWTLEHEERGYEGHSDYYIPAGRKGMETLVAQLVSATFPGGDNFDAVPIRDAFAADANDLKLVLRHRIENVAKVRVAAEVFYRQLVAVGNSPVKVIYDRRTVKSRRLPRRGAQELFEGVQAEQVLYDGPVFATLDAENFYVWPETVNRLEDAELVFEDLTTSLSALRAKARAGVYAKAAVEEVCHGARNDSKERTTVARLSAQGLTSPHDTAAGAYGLCDITEVWLDFDPDAPSRDEEEYPVPFLVTLTASGEVLRAVKNPFWHQRAPYLLGRAHTVQGRVYGEGFLVPVRELNKLLNDQVNQGMDCSNYVLNPIVLTNPDLILGALQALEPGVQWLVRDVQGAVRFDRPPPDLVMVASQLATQTQAWIGDFIGAPPVLQGGSSPGRAFRTATGVGTAQRNAVVPLQEVVRLCEKEVWEPMLKFFHSLDQQFARDDYFIEVTGNEVKRVSPDILAGDWRFQWLASTQAQNQQVKGQQILQLLQMLAPLTPLLQQAGYRLNPEPLVRRLYTEVYGFRDVDRVVQPLQPGAAPGAGGGSAPPGKGPVPAPPATGEPSGEQALIRQAAEEMSGGFGPLGAAGPAGGSEEGEPFPGE